VTISRGELRWTRATFMYREPRSTPRMALADTDTAVLEREAPRSRRGFNTFILT